MKTSLLILAAVLLGAPAWVPAQEMRQTRDAGVANTVLLDRDDVRILRVEVQPGAVRQIHQHDDVKFHLFIPLTEGLELTVSGKPANAPLGQAFYLAKGTPHGFRNTGTSKAMIVEVFVKPGAPVAQKDALGAAFLALAGSTR